jgi:hypothetical protein
MYVILMVVTAVLSAFTTYYTPKIKRSIIARINNKKRKLETLVRLEVEKQLKEIINDN